MNHSPEAIIEMFDGDPDMTLRGLALITGWSVSELKTLLTGGAS